jgi:antitoxin (DNA-binding transcriptional repressor) of toxin-antitoxin stability system
MESISVSQFKAQCLGILENLHKQKKRIVITKRGIPIAEVRALESEEAATVPLKDTLVFMKDIISPIAENDWEATQ